MRLITPTGSSSMSTNLLVAWACVTTVAIMSASRPGLIQPNPPSTFAQHPPQSHSTTAKIFRPYRQAIVSLLHATPTNGLIPQLILIERTLDSLLFLTFADFPTSPLQFH